MTGTNGPLTSATKGIEQSVKDLGKRYDSMSEHIDANIKRVQKQFQALDLAVSQMNRTKDYLTQQFSAMNNTNSK